MAARAPCRANNKQKWARFLKVVFALICTRSLRKLLIYRNDVTGMSDGGGGRARALSKKRCKCVFLLVCVCCFFCMCLFLFVFIFVCVYLCVCVLFLMSGKLRCVFSTDRGSRVLSSDNSFYLTFFVL